MSDRVRHGSRQPDPLTSRYQPGHAIFDNSSKLLRRGYFASPQRPQSFVADEPPRTYHSRRRNNSLSDSTLVNEDVGGDLTPALRQGPPSYIDAAPSLPDLQCPDWCRENRRQVAENRRHQLHEPAWMDRAKWERRVEEDDELERHISRITGLDYPPGRGLNRPYRQAEPDRSAAMASCSLCNPKASRPNNREEDVTVTIDKTFDKVGFMILSDDGKSATWVGQGGLSTPPTLEKKPTTPRHNKFDRFFPRGAPAADGIPPQDVGKGGLSTPRAFLKTPTIGKFSRVLSRGAPAADSAPARDTKPANLDTTLLTGQRHHRRIPNNVKAKPSASPAPSEKAASNKDADETKSEQSNKSKRSNASNQSDERTARADSNIDEGSSLGIYMFFD
ncbi:hypothetical protein IWZ01DRAFT_483936 [Phyllosticta capitalensis]